MLYFQSSKITFTSVSESRLRFPISENVIFEFFETKVLDVHVFIMVLSEKKSKGKERTTMSMSKYRPFRHYLGR